MTIRAELVSMVDASIDSIWAVKLRMTPDVATNCSMLHEHLEPAIESELELGWFEMVCQEKVSADDLSESKQ